jgi:nitrile hydratase beta subunit
VNGVHDMGGMHGFGKVTPEANEPPFHAPWEGRVMAMNRALGYLGLWNIDIGRYWIEKLPAPFYLGATYYEKWHVRMENLAMHYGLVAKEELAAGHALHPAKPVKRTMTMDKVGAAMTRGCYYRDTNTTPVFKPGDRVRTVNINPETHTRLPRYARDKTGIVEAVRGCHVYPDSVTRGEGENPQWVYTVVFTSQELWGESADPTLKVSIEAFEPYLEAA